jgi:flagellar biosynthesis/type III secretory pathway M-ring protein FliF/YscJ
MVELMQFPMNTDFGRREIMEGKGGKRRWFLIGLIAIIIILAFVGGQIMERSHKREQAEDLQKKMQEAAKTLQKQSEEMKKAGEQMQKQMQQQAEESRKAAEELQKQSQKK